LAARCGRAPELVIVSARKGAKGIFVLEAPLILHDGAQHDIDRDSASLLAKSVLRDGNGLEDAKFMHR
jgi:tRNA1(Val) A37 N6-methylase TrmN6